MYARLNLNVVYNIMVLAIIKLMKVTRFLNMITLSVRKAGHSLLACNQEKRSYKNVKKYVKGLNAYKTCDDHNNFLSVIWVEYFAAL